MSYCYNTNTIMPDSIFITTCNTLAYYYGTPHTQGGYGYSSLTLLGLGLIILAALVGCIIRNKMMAAMHEFSAQPAPFSGAEIAAKMLTDNGLSNVRITHIPGELTDHYNPANHSVNLSESVYAERTVAAMAVAAHECGHAIQHARAYPWLSMRSQLVPIVSLGSRLGQIVLTIGLILVAAGAGTTVAWVGLLLFATTTVFALVTLPVEFDASRRALAWMQSSGVADRTMHGQAGTALKWAAMTYVAAALSSIAMLAYYIFILLNSNRDNR